MEQLADTGLSISVFHLFSQVFSLWFENVENDGSITPDKAIVCGEIIKKNYLLSNKSERQSRQNMCAYFSLATPQLRLRDMNKLKW